MPIQQIGRRRRYISSAGASAPLGPVSSRARIKEPAVCTTSPWAPAGWHWQFFSGPGSEHNDPAGCIIEARLKGASVSRSEVLRPFSGPHRRGGLGRRVVRLCPPVASRSRSAEARLAPLPWRYVCPAERRFVPELAISSGMDAVSPLRRPVGRRPPANDCRSSAG